MPSALEKERGKKRAEVDAALAEDDDPLPAYTDFVKWMIEYTPEDKQGLIALLKEVTDKFRDDDAYRNSRPYLQLWCLYAARVDRPALIFAYLLKKRIGVAWAQLYEEYAAVLEKSGE
jgi:checkpoint serine/threonine-protein kinase